MELNINIKMEKEDIASLMATLTSPSTIEAGMKAFRTSLEQTLAAQGLSQEQRESLEQFFSLDNGYTS